jgi:hypothetical protein
LEQIALNTMQEENTAYIFNEGLFSITIHLCASFIIAYEDIGVSHELIKVGIAP